MTTLAITRRPIVLGVSSPAAVLAQLLERMATIRGRMGAWGVADDQTRAELLAGASIEGGFNASYYRQAFAVGTQPSFLPGWTFSRSSTALGPTSTGALTSFASGAPRINETGLRIERQSTNRFVRSSEFDNGAWTKSGLTISANGFTAPDGTLSADQLIESASNEVHYVQQNDVATGPGTMSVYALPNGRNAIGFQLGTQVCRFDLTGEGSVIGGVAGASIERVAGGFYRCSWGRNIESETRLIFLVNGESAAYLGDGVQGVFLWGAQTEPGLSSTSYIPTGAATATRASEPASVNWAALPDEDFSAFASFDADTPLTEAVLPLDIEGPAGARVYIALTTSGHVAVAFSVPSGAPLPAVSTPRGPGTNRVAFARRGRTIHVAVNGAMIGSQLLPAAPHLTKVGIGSSGGSGSSLVLDGVVSRFALVGAPMSDAELEAISS